MIKPVALALALALLLLYASLFPILRKVSGALDARTHWLQEKSDELEKTSSQRTEALASLRELEAQDVAGVEPDAHAEHLLWAKVVVTLGAGAKQRGQTVVAGSFVRTSGPVGGLWTPAAPTNVR